MNDVLYQMCRYCIQITDGSRPVSSNTIANSLGLTRNQARYRLRKLKQLGLVESCCEVLKDDDGYRLLPFHGWRLADKAKETEEYKKVWEEERALCKKCFDMDIGECEK